MSGNDIDRTLADWFEADALAQAPADGVERALDGARRRTPRPAWLAGPGSHWIGDSIGPTSGVATLGRPGLRRSMALLLLLLLALALAAGAVLVGARLLQPAPSTVPLAAGQLVLYLEEWRGEGGEVERNEVAVYADGRVIWGPDEQDPYLEQRLTPEGLERLRSRALSTGLFERDLIAIGNGVVGSGFIKVIRGVAARPSVSRVLSHDLRRGDGHPSEAAGCPAAHAADPRAGQRASPPTEVGLRPPIWPCSG